MKNGNAQPFMTNMTCFISFCYKLFISVKHLNAILMQILKTALIHSPRMIKKMTRSLVAVVSLTV